MSAPSEPIVIPLSPFQQERFASLQRDVTAAQNRVNDSVTAIVASVADPASVMGWHIKYIGPELVCTPPTNGNGEEPT